MSETRFTITLGRTGQVVKRGGGGGGSKHFSDEFLSVNKRWRGDEFKRRPSGNRYSGIMSNVSGKDSHDKGDLRLKLIRKRRAEELRKRHLQEKQLKPVQQQRNSDVLMHEHQAKGRDLLRQYPKKGIFAGLNQNFRMEASARFSHPVAPPSYNLPKSPAVAPATGVSSSTLTVPSLLHSLGLRKYASKFQAEEVDMDALKQMSDKDLNALGIPMGPRKKILRALQAYKKQQL